MTFWVSYTLRWFEAFAFTQLVEAPLYRRALGVPWSRALAASALTHPVVWFGFFHPALRLSYNRAAIASEIFAFVVEAAWFARGAGWWRALVVSLVANATSLGLGLAWGALFGRP